MTITNCWVTGCYELGTVLDGTFKKFAPGVRCPSHRPHQMRHGIERRIHQHRPISNCVFEGCLGYALESVDGALLEDLTITNTTMRDLSRGPYSSCAWARGCAVPKKPRKSEP